MPQESALHIKDLNWLVRPNFEARKVAIPYRCRRIFLSCIRFYERIFRVVHHHLDGYRSIAARGIRVHRLIVAARFSVKILEADFAIGRPS